jgi:hypothetical protein
MNLILELVVGIVRAVTKVTLIALAALFALGVLCGALVLVAVAVIRYLLTGRKPAVWATFSQFRNSAQQFRAGRWSGAGGSARPGDADIVDVQAHEVRTVISVPLASKTRE